MDNDSGRRRERERERKREREREERERERALNRMAPELMREEEARGTWRNWPPLEEETTSTTTSSSSTSSSNGLWSTSEVTSAVKHLGAYLSQLRGSETEEKKKKKKKVSFSFLRFLIQKTDIFQI